MCEKQKNWNIYMQRRAVMYSLINKTVQAT